MLQILLILFTVSMLGVGIILIQHRKHGNNKLLHYMKKSCNIDSIEFEKKLKHSSKTAHTLFNLVSNFIQKIVDILQKGFNHFVESSKKRIRNTLFDTNQNGVVSEYITKLKDNSKE